MLSQSNVITVSDNRAKLCRNVIFAGYFHSSEGIVNSKNQRDRAFIRLLRKDF